MEGNKKKDRNKKEGGKSSKDQKDSETNTKTTGAKKKERWLLTRKTWRYMSDAGKKLFPDGANPHKKEDVPKFEEQFQQISDKCEEYILWNPNMRKSHGDVYDNVEEDEKFDYADDSLQSPTGHAFDPVKDKFFSELGWDLPPEIYNTLLRNYGASTLQRVASKLLEEQLMEEDENAYDDDGGEFIEIDGRSMRSVGTQTDPYLDMCVQTDHDGSVEDDVNVGAETKAETEAAVAYQRALMMQEQHRQKQGQELQQQHHQPQQQFLQQRQQIQLPRGDFEQQVDMSQDPHLRRYSLQSKGKNYEDSQPLMSTTQGQSFYGHRSEEAQQLQEAGESQSPSSTGPLQSHLSHHHTYVQQQQQISALDQSYQSQRPVLKKFWARRESLTAKAEPQHSQPTEKIGKISDKIQIAIEKEKDLLHQKGTVPTKPTSVESASSPSLPFTPIHQKQDNLKQQQQEKKKQNVFKLGLKCDVESQQGGNKISVEKAAMDKFKTVNYDKTLRNIKSKWVPTDEDEEYIRSIERENELERERVKSSKLKEKEKVKLKEKEERLQEKEKEKEAQKEKEKEKAKEKEKKKKKARSIQVGEPLPQFILNSFRINSPVEIIHATKKKLRRFSSKAESISESESSIPPSGMMSPRFSISILDDQGSRDLVVSEAEAYRLSQMGIPFIYKRPSTENSSEIGELEGSFRETSHHFQRSFSAVQASGHISQLLYHLRASRLSNPLWGGSSHLGGRSSDKAQRLTHSLLQYLLPAVMQRSRGSGGGGHASRLVAKRIWRTRSKSQSRASAGTTSIWTPMGNSTWMSVTGRVSNLESTSLIHLSELERLSMQRISLAKLQAMNLGCQIKMPKEISSSTPNKKKRPYLLKRKALSTGLFDPKKEEHRGTTGGLVFGLSLNKCIENERLRVRETAEREALALAAASTPSGEEGDGSLSRKSSQAGSNASFTSLLEGAKQSTTGSLESLNLERKRPSLGGADVLSGAGPTSLDLLTVDPVPQVPALVSNCCRFLEGHGLHTLGIFRVSSSKKRVRQLREEFDSGKEIVLTEEHCPHDVATLLKEFFRDLPEPLLTRELYEPLLSTQKIRNRKLQLEALQYLIQLLPKPNRDTLYSLLNFLTTVADHSSDSECDAGQGNKMDSSNLATLFAPNILHQIKPGSDTLSTSEMAAQAEERIDVINVVRCMIDHNKELFQVTPELLDETYQHLMDSHPEALDILLRRRCAGLDEPCPKQNSQHLFSTLMDSGRTKTYPTHPSPSLSQSSCQGLDLEVDTNSSVFEGSDASSPLPRSPTDHQEFEKLRTSLAMEDSEGFRRDVPTAQEISSERTRRRRRHEEEEFRRQYQEKRSSGEGFVEEKGWFRRREKSGSRELERGIDHVSERSRWFRRREKNSPKEEKVIIRQGSDKNKDKATTRPDSTRSKEGVHSQELTEPVNDRRNKMLHEQEKLRVPEPSVRRLSSPEIDTFGVITASLKIHVPLQQQSTIAFSKESESTYIEEANLSEEEKLRLKEGTVSVSSRQRTGSNDSFLGQPITGSMSFQPLCKKDGDKQSYDSVLSSSSIGVYTMSPSERNTPSSDFHCASGTSSPMSGGALSPPLWLSPDSGTPGLSPPNSPPPQRRRSRKIDDPAQKPVPLSHSATHTFGSKPTAPLRMREKSRIQPTPIGRSRTTDSMKLEETIEHKIIETRARIDGSRSRNNTEKESTKKYTRKRYSAERHHTGHLPEITPRNARASTTESTTQLWKRWEIIASDPTEPETFV